MKPIVIAIFMLFFIPFLVSAQSQIVLSASNEIALQPGVYLGRVVNTANLAPPASGANKTWDYSKLKGGTIYTNSLIGAGALFPNTAVADTSGMETIANGLSIPVSEVYDMDNLGFFGAGEIIVKQDYSVSGATGGKYDSLIVPAQDFKYHENHLSFPTTYGNTWKSNSKHNIKFIVKAPSVFLPNDSARKLSRITITDSVAGWGALSIPSFNKGSIPYPVLLVKEQTRSIDSFFLLGAPAPTILLQKFGVVQGQVSSSFSEYFYRTGTLEPLLTIGYDTDYTYTNPSTASFTADNVQSDIDDENIANQNIALYPNPNSSDIVLCSFAKLSPASWQLMVFNSLGQIIGNQLVNGTGNLKEQIDLSPLRTSGLYFINILDENGSLVDSGKLSLLR